MGIDEREIAVTFWGVRGSTPCANRANMEYGGNTSCLEVDIPDTDEVLILDSGTGIRNFGNKLVNQKSQINGRIFITHPHWDHIQGFPFFKPIYGSDNHFAIHMPDQGEEGGCKDILDGHLTKTFFPVTLNMIDANLEYITQPQELVAYEGYKVEFILANHTVQTAVYKIHIDDKQLVFCPDNEIGPLNTQKTVFQKRMIKFAQGADLLIHDGQYNRKTYRNRQGWGHSAWEHAIDFAKEAEVDRLFITHHDPDSDDEKLLALDEYLRVEYGGLFKEIGLAREGTQVKI
jgi:phosphoribosyl 1,2-cyclic phosphodiesterase